MAAGCNHADMCTEVGIVAGVTILQIAAESSAREIGRLWKMERTPFLRVSKEPRQAPRVH